MPKSELLKAILSDPLVSDADKSWFRRVLVIDRAPSRLSPRAARLRPALG